MSAVHCGSRSPRLYEHVTLTCQNVSCPRPGRVFRVPIRQISQKYCSPACSQAGIQTERIERLRAAPPMTANQFAECAQRFRRTTPALQAAARQVLVDGSTATLVARATGCSQKSLSRVVGKFRAAMEQAKGKRRSERLDIERIPTQ